MKKLKLLAGFVILAMSAYGMLHVKHRVQVLTKDLVEVKRQITMEKEALHVLKAEWAYLNHPDRLKFLADQYLDMHYASGKQLALSVKEGVGIIKGPSPKIFAAKPILKPTLSRFER